MNKPYCILIFILFFSFSNLAFTQINIGGVPPSFKLFQKTSVEEINMIPFSTQKLVEEDLIEDSKNEPYRFGKRLDVNFGLKTNGNWTEIQGGKIWRLKVKSENALTLNLQFDDFYMPEGGQFFIYNEDKTEVLGAFTKINNKSDGKFATGLVRGEVLVLEYYEPTKSEGKGRINVECVIHGYRNFGLKAFNSSGSCNNNTICPEAAAWQDEKKAIALILVNGNRSCTGALVNNTLEDCTPYFLTANHCIGGMATGTVANNWVFMFNYDSPICSPNQDGPTNQTVAGATLLSKGATSDFALFEISVDPGNPPAPATGLDVYYAGWSNIDVAAPSATAIHHPAGDVKKISFENDVLTSSTWSGTAGSHWRVNDWDDGTTEPGSSGSPLFDDQHRIIGQLHGGGAACGNNLEDLYGKVAYSWNNGGSTSSNARLQDWLDPNNSGVGTLDGRFPCTDQPPVALFNSDLTQVCPGGSISFADNSSYNPTSWSWTFQGGTPSTSNAQNPNVTYNSAGVYNVSLTVSNPFGNDATTVSGYVTVSVVGGNPIPSFHDFDAGIAPWTTNNPNNDGPQWALANNDACNNDVIAINNFDDDNRGTLDFLSQTFDFTGYTNVSLTFDVAYARYNNNYWDGLKVEILPCTGGSFDVYNKSSSILATAADTDAAFVPADCSEWRGETVDLSAYDGQIVTLRFVNEGGWGNWLYLDNVNVTGTPSNVEVQARAFLEGPYKNNGTMQDILGFTFAMQLAQPYDVAPWNYNGTESTVIVPAAAVDWVLVEIRNGIGGTNLVASQAAFIDTDGYITQTNGIRGVSFSSFAPGNYYVCIRHRSHLDVMSANMVSLPNASNPYDFTTAQSQSFGNTMGLSLDGKFYLFAGDANGDGENDVDDFNRYKSEASNIYEYLTSDFNMDGFITIEDFNFYKRNFTRQTTNVLKY